MLPIVFVSLGLGSVIASIVGVAPWIAIVGRHKETVFVTVAALLAFNYWIAILRPSRVACAPGDACHVDAPAMRANRALFWTSVALYVAAVAMTYGALWWVRIHS